MPTWVRELLDDHRMQSSWRPASGRHRDARELPGDFSAVGWFAVMSALVVVVTMLLVGLSASTGP